jgi:hypothetical protein
VQVASYIQEMSNLIYYRVIFKLAMQLVQISIEAEYKDHIDFHWTLDVKRCMKVLDGFLLSVKDPQTGLTESNMINRTRFVVIDGKVKFNTADAHMNIRPCTNYTVEIMPRVANRTLFDMKGSVNATTAGTWKCLDFFKYEILKALILV